MPVARAQLCSALDRLLTPSLFTDYCPNGLQVEGRDQIFRLVSGVTACKALIDAAIEWQADALLVHHGYFWKSEDPCIRGMKGARIRALLRADVNLLAYHLPLDCHPTLGNNAGLGNALGVSNFGPAKASDPTWPVFSGTLSQSTTLASLAARLANQLNREVLCEGDGEVRTVAWCTGGGQGYIEAAADLGVDLFVSGEVSEQTIHIARERGIAFIAAGHHATERFGPQNVGAWAAERFDIEHRFIDVPNPA